MKAMETDPFGFAKCGGERYSFLQIVLTARESALDFQSLCCR